jgi:dTDP-4-amino-4,6-dideoxygalactose transaminase
MTTENKLTQNTSVLEKRTNKSFRIPFNKPYVSGQELNYISEVLNLGHISGDGKFTKLCSSLLEKSLDAKKVFITTSCTHALEISALLLDIKPGDEVIVPSFTFVSTINAFVLRGAIPRFIDIRPDTLNLNETLLEKLITPKTKAIVPVHYAGVGCEMEKITDIANRYNIAIVEDNAHGLFGAYKSKPLGSFGQMSTLSFHETKNISCGEGGALVINDEQFSERAEILREKGTNRGRFFRGQVDKYTWVDIGSSYLPSDMLAAFLYAQLEQKEHIQNVRKNIWLNYQSKLKDWAQANGIKLPYVPVECDQAYHMFYLLMPDLTTRQRFIAHLKDHSILSVYHYVPLHTSEMGIKYGGYQGMCPNTESISEQLVRLPFYNGITENEQNEVIEAILQFKA